MQNTINIEDFIMQVIEYQAKTIELLRIGVEERYDDYDIINYFVESKRDFLFINSAISKKIADYCQLLNNEKNFDKISLAQIQTIYEGLIKINPLDLSFYESLAFYLNNVQDRPEEAKGVLRSGIEFIQTKIADLKRQLEDFE